MVRIAHMITTLDRGGAEMDLVRLIENLDPSHFQHMVISLKGPGPLSPILSNLGVHVMDRGVGRPTTAMRSIPSAVRALRRFRPHIIQGWLPHGNIAALAAGRLLRVPVCWKVLQTLNAASMKFEKPSTARLIRLGARYSSRPARIIYNTYAGRADHEAAGYASSGGTVIANGFDTRRFRPSAADREAVRRELGLPQDALLAGVVARWHPHKDQPTFIAAASRLIRDGSAAHFLLIGKGNDESNPDLRAVLRLHSPGPSLHLLGERADVPRLSAALDVACLTSVSEGLPNAIGEAMACAVPAVVTDVGDARRLVNDTGLVVPAGDVDAVAHALHTLLSMDRQERVDLGLRARERVSTPEYSIQGVAARHATLYEDISGAAGALHA